MVKPLSQIGSDSTKFPFPTDWKTYINNLLVTTYFDQPNIARQMNDLVIKLNYDGKTEAEIPSLDDIDEAEVGMQPGINDVEESGDLINVKTPQIFITARKTHDHWKQTFAGKNRKDLLMSRMGVKIKNREDLYVFQGKTGLTDGVVADSTDLGEPTAAWGIATAGKLENAFADIRTLVNTLDANGVPNNMPIDIAVTTYLLTIFQSTFLDYEPTTNNLVMILKLLRGGRIISSNNLQASVSSTANTMFASVRAPKSDPGWALLASGFDMDEERVMWGRRVGIRQKVGYKILNGDLVYFMDEISAATA